MSTTPQPNDDWKWLENWIEKEDLELAIPQPTTNLPGIDTSTIRGLQQYTREFASNNNRNNKEGSLSSWKTHPVKNNITIRSCHAPGLPIFTVEWECNVTKTSLQQFLDFSMFRMQELASQWDSTYIDAECLATHGDPKHDIKTYAKLMKWKFRMPSPFSNREMLYLVVPIVMDDCTTLMTYVSVESPKRFPLSKGYVRAYNCVPSFDMAKEVIMEEECNENSEMKKHTKGLVIRHTLTTQIGGWVSDCMWNQLFQGPVISNYYEEAEKVRSMLQEEFS